MLGPKIKICGICRIEDALAAASLGVDAVGFVFYDKSPRYISPIRAAAIIRKMPPFLTAVGLFVNPSQEEVDDTLRHCPLDILQFHGNESPEFCEAQQRRVIKAIGVGGREDLLKISMYDCPVLLDAKAPAGRYGGTGETFDWSLLGRLRQDRPLLLAGGLNVGNVREAMRIHPWYALDVSSGVESYPGAKDAEKMKAFVQAVRSGGGGFDTV